MISCVHYSLKVHFKDSEGNLIRTVEANEGDDILAIAHEYDIDLEGALPCALPLCCLRTYGHISVLTFHRRLVSFPYTPPVRLPVLIQ